MKKEHKIMIAMGIVILILLVALIVPKVINSIKNTYKTEGYNECIVLTVNTIISDLQNKGYTQINLGNQTIKLGVIEESSFIE